MRNVVEAKNGCASRLHGAQNHIRPYWKIIFLIEVTKVVLDLQGTHLEVMDFLVFLQFSFITDMERTKCMKIIFACI